MKRSFKVFITLILCLLACSTNFNDKLEVIKNQSEYDFFADYNEYYGIEESIQPQVKVKSSVGSTQYLKYLAVFIEFQDSDTVSNNHLDDDVSVANAEKLMNSENPIEMDSVNGLIEVPSFKSYYEKQSYGKLSVSTEIFPRENGKVVSYRDSHPMGYYLKYSESNPTGYKDKEESLKRETELINGAVDYVADIIAAEGITPEEIDTGADGIIDAISFFIEGADYFKASINWGDLLWSHKIDNYNITATILDKKVISYNLLYTYDFTEVAGLFSLNRGTYGTIIHEFGHTLGFMDLYRFDKTDSEPVGFYDVMGKTVGSNPQNFLTYFISEYDTSTSWHKPLPVVDKTTENITLYNPEFTDDNEQRAIKIQLDSSSKEFFVVEYHKKQNTYSTHSATESGIIVYRVNDNNKYDGNKVSGDHGEYDHVFVFRPNETQLGAGKGELVNATLNMNRRTLGKDITLTQGFDNGTIYFADGSNSGLVIEVTGETDDSVTFNIKFPTRLGSGTKTDPYLIDSAESFIYQMSLNTIGKYYKLVRDLDFKDIANYPKIDFEGNLDGDGKTIKNITSSYGIFNSIGMYGLSVRVENLFVDNLIANSDTGAYLGGFVSTAASVTLNNIHLLSGEVNNVESKMGNSLDSTGGFAGNVSMSTVITNCSSSLDVNAPSNVGGFIGLNGNASIANCFANGHINGGSIVGGFIGLQCITEETYKLPSNVYYGKTRGSFPLVGGSAGRVHNESALPNDDLARGIVEVAVSESVYVRENETIHFEPKFSNSSSIAHRVTLDSSLATYVDGNISGIARGDGYIFVEMDVGTRVMQLKTALFVEGNDVPMTEREFLNKLGLSKKENYISGFKIGESVLDVSSRIAKIDGVELISFKNAAQEEIVDGLIATGMSFVIDIAGSTYEYIVVVKGDANGDGLIYATDYVKIKNQIMGRSTLDGAYLLAADIDNDGNIYAIDYVKIKNYIMGRGEIIQNL